ncbi:MAG TPA: hypothetical protein VFD92_20825 [Candidatus Binatia bacterium]|nr:hypothetical protein [Candidatus Binatia bacterium]
MYDSADPVRERLLEPEVLTPEQYVDRVRARSTDRPEVRLMCAVIEDAILSYLSFASPEPAVRRKGSLNAFRQIESWIESRDYEWPYSFENICSALELDAEHLRRGLRRWRDSGQTPRFERTKPRQLTIGPRRRRRDGVARTAAA